MCCTMVRYAVLCCAVLCRAVPCRAVLCCASLRFAALCCAVLCHAVLCCTTVRYAVLCFALLSYAVLCFVRCQFFAAKVTVPLQSEKRLDECNSIFSLEDGGACRWSQWKCTCCIRQTSNITARQLWQTSLERCPIGVCTQSALEQDTPHKTWCRI